MKKKGNSRTSLLFQQEIITTCRHRPLIDPMLLIILILPILGLLFLFFLSHVPKIIKPASIKSTLDCFNLFLVLLVILSRVSDPEDDDPSTNKVVENDQKFDVEGVKDESHFYDSGNINFYLHICDFNKCCYTNSFLLVILYSRSAHER